MKFLMQISDKCEATQTSDHTKGSFNWPEVLTGTRFFIRCPYAFEEKLYAHYDCILDETNNATWTPSVSTKDCPGPPLYELSKTFERETEAHLANKVFSCK